MSILDNISKTLDRIAIQSETAKQMINQTAELQSAATINRSSDLGATLGQVLGGFQLAVSNIDDVLSNVPNSIPSNVTAGVHTGVVQMTSDIELADQLIKEVEGSADLQKISNNANLTAQGFLDVVVSAPFPEAIAASTKQAVPSATTAQLQSVTKKTIQPTNVQLPPLAELASVAGALSADLNKVLDNVVGSATSSLKGGLASLNNTASSLITNLVNKADSRINVGFGTLIENAVEQTFQPALTSLQKIASKNGIPQQISQTDLSVVAHLRSIGDIEKATKLMKKYSDVDEDAIFNAINDINNNLSAQLGKEPAQFNPQSIVSADISNQFKSGNPGINYFRSTVSKQEHLAELIKLKRPVTEIIITSSDTGNDVFLDAFNYYRSFNQQTNQVPPIHYLISRKGTVQRIVPVEEDFTGSQYYKYLEYGHDESSIVVMLVGGGIGPGFKPAQQGDTYSINQKETLKEFLKTSYNVIPGIQVLGASEVTSQSSAPHFDVDQFVKTHFFKTRIEKDLEEGPYTLDEISGVKD